MLLSIHPFPHVVHFNVSSFPSNNLHHVNFSLWSAFFLCPSSVIFSSFVSLFPDSELLCISSILRFSYLLPCFSLLFLLRTLARAVDHRVYLLPRAHFAARTVRRANVIRERQLRANRTAGRWTSYDAHFFLLWLVTSMHGWLAGWHKYIPIFFDSHWNSNTRNLTSRIFFISSSKLHCAQQSF